MVKGIRSWRRRLRRLAAVLLAGLGLLFLVVSFTPLTVWWATLLRGDSYTDKGDVLIVLSGSMDEDGSMGWTSYLRTTYAYWAFRDGGFKDVVVAGGAVPPSRDAVAKAMGDFLKFQGVPVEAIHLETQSRSTRENALYSAQLLKTLAGRKVLLTSDYHAYRARRAFARAGVEVAVLPIPDVLKRSGQWRARWLCFLDLVEETMKIGYYALRGWI
jgi:uncharacterized SAM-binding protein YcdF (DUF218 family)